MHLHNFMIDLDWVFESCPALRAYLFRNSGVLRVFHGARQARTPHLPGGGGRYLINLTLMPTAPIHSGDGMPPRSRAAAAAAAAKERGVAGTGKLLCYQPPCERFGTHHSKAIVIVRPQLLSVHILTGNLLFSDWLNKTNAVWTGTFPRVEADSSSTSERRAGNKDASGIESTSPHETLIYGEFGSDLAEYYGAIKGIGASPPPRWEPSNREQRQLWAALDFSWIASYDYTSAGARLVASVPGKTAGRHVGAQMCKWGHMRLRRLIDLNTRRHSAPSRGGKDEPATSPVDRRADDMSAIVLQFSSLSSVGNGTAWLEELISSMNGGRSSLAAPPIRIVYPTRRQVGDSIEGWVAGASLPCASENASKLEDALAQLSAPSAAGRQTTDEAQSSKMPYACLCRWECGPANGGAAGCLRARAVAMPHIKSYARVSMDGNVEWAVLTSANLSQAAWGKLEKKGSQVCMQCLLNDEHIWGVAHRGGRPQHTSRVLRQCCSCAPAPLHVALHQVIRAWRLHFTFITSTRINDSPSGLSNTRSTCCYTHNCGC